MSWMTRYRSFLEVCSETSEYVNSLVADMMGERSVVEIVRRPRECSDLQSRSVGGRRRECYDVVVGLRWCGGVCDLEDVVLSATKCRGR